ncbi:MAG: hypothetical protein HOY71_28040, partial [Nonomuraea sp.]|nr:hypothetical protein [Nonomuraea sp.]
QRMPDDRLVELLADAGERALDARVPATEALAAATRGYLDTIVELAERKLAGSLRSV